MAVKSLRKVWSGVTLDESIDTKTGKMTLSKGEDLQLAHSDTTNWVIDQPASFARLYNNANSLTALDTTELSVEDFEGIFYSEVNTFNEDRANVLNNPSNFTDIDANDILRTQQSFFDERIPGISNPITKQQVTSKSDVTIGNPDGIDPQTFENASNFISNAVGRVTNNRSLRGTTSRSSIASMRYPIGQIPDLGYDFIQFEVYDYSNKDGTLTVENAEERLGAKLETITLPMVGNLSDTTGVDWGGDKLNPIKKIAGQTAMDAIDSASEFDVQGIADAFSGGVTQAKDALLKDPGTKSAIAAYFAGQAVGANLLTRGTGQVLNPNLELLFSGPSLRSFSFNFAFRPRSQDESQMIRAIIRTFKRAMAPIRSTSSFFLQTPNVFKIKYILNSGEEHPFMNRIKPCALTNFGVSYTPDGSYMTYDDGGLTGYDVKMSFGELTPIYADDHEEAGGMGF
jgi:hypothetical protein